MFDDPVNGDTTEINYKKMLPLLCDLMGQNTFAAVGEFKYVGSILSSNISECVEMQRLWQAKKP